VPVSEVLAHFHVAAAPTLVTSPPVDAKGDADLLPQADLPPQADSLRLWPHRHATDAFFAAVWKRR
jgi:hypothetical protein